MPKKLARGQVHGQNRVAGIGCWRRIGLTGADIETVAFHVDAGAIPDRGTRRMECGRTIAVGVAGQAWVFRDGACLPDLLAGFSIQCHHTATKRAAFVSGVSG